MSGAEKSTAPKMAESDKSSDVAVPSNSPATLVNMGGPVNPVQTKAAAEGGEKEQDCSGDKELPEPIRPARELMPGIPPPIGLRQLKDMLCSPNMPELKIMKLVANKIGLTAYNSDDAGSDGGSDGGSMRGLFDCIMETTLCQSDQSDDSEDDEEEHVSRPREIPCSFCNKIFLGNMRLKTHVLVVHSKQDPSLFNESRKPPSLLRSLSRGKSGDLDARPLSIQGQLNVEITDETVGKPGGKLQTRGKASPKSRAVLREKLDPAEGENKPVGVDTTSKPSSQPADIEKLDATTQSNLEDVSRVSPSLNDPSDGGPAGSKPGDDVTPLPSPRLSPAPETEPTSPKMTRQRRKSAASTSADQASQAKTRHSSSSSNQERPKRKSSDAKSSSLSPGESSAVKKAKVADSAPSGTRRSSVSRRNR